MDRSGRDKVIDFEMKVQYGGGFVTSVIACFVLLITILADLGNSFLDESMRSVVYLFFIVSLIASIIYWIFLGVLYPNKKSKVTEADEEKYRKLSR